MTSEQASKSPSAGKPHVLILDMLRGIAALSVVLFHFSGSTLPTIKPNLLTDFFSWGKLGVQVFFVISGFIIPYSMYLSGYVLSDFFRFIGRRLVRIGPPSYIAILLSFGIYYGSIWFIGKPVEGMYWPGTDAKTILANLTYFYTILDAGAYIDVFWTLEVELQYYLLIGLLLPVILRYARNTIVLSLLLILLNCSFLVHHDYILFFRDNSFFLLGILLFLYKTGNIGRDYFIYAAMVAMLMCYAQKGLEESFAAIIAFLIIAFVQFANPVTTFLGKISYSLYITHFFSGVMFEYILRNITGEDPGQAVRIFMLFVYTGCSVGFAWIFYMMFEQPFIRLSQKIRAKHPGRQLKISGSV